jgi:hypothetical protein
MVRMGIHHSSSSPPRFLGPCSWLDALACVLVCVCVCACVLYIYRDNNNKIGHYNTILRLEGYIKKGLRYTQKVLRFRV